MSLFGSNPDASYTSTIISVAGTVDAKLMLTPEAFTAFDPLACSKFTTQHHLPQTSTVSLHSFRLVMTNCYGSYLTDYITAQMQAQACPTQRHTQTTLPTTLTQPRTPTDSSKGS